MWEIDRRPAHYGDHLRPRVADRGTHSRVDKRVAPDREGAADKQWQGEGKLLSEYVITNREEGKGKPPRLFHKTGYPLGYPEPALQQKTEERICLPIKPLLQERGTLPDCSLAYLVACHHHDPVTQLTPRHTYMVDFNQRKARISPMQKNCRRMWKWTSFRLPNEVSFLTEINIYYSDGSKL